MSKAKKLTAVVVGGGGAGRACMNVFHNSQKFELLAAADINPEARKKLKEDFQGIQTFADHVEMFKKCPVDVVCVSTYPPSHEQVTMDALTIPSLKGILVEKPLADSVASARRFMKAIKARKLPMVVPHGMFTKGGLEVIARVKAGDIGRLELVEIESHWDLMSSATHWLVFFVQLAGISSMDWLMSICDTEFRSYCHGSQVETRAVSYSKANNGVRCVLHTGDSVRDQNTRNFPKRSAIFRIWGSSGQIICDSWPNSYFIQNKEFPEGKVIECGAFSKGTHQRYLEAMADMIHQGTLDYTIPDSSLLALEIVEGSYVSSLNRCQVTFPVDQFVPPSPTDWNPGTPYSGKGGGEDLIKKYS